jgi:hypothetical protein
MPPAGPFEPSEGVNHPLGEGKGIYPGRVVWVRDAKAATWDGKTGFWWDDASTDARAVGRMTSTVLLELTGRKNEKQAWDALFRHFNETHGRGNSGYRRGEKIAIKINANQDRGPDWSYMVRGGMAARAGGGPPRPPQNGLPSPHAVVALVRSLTGAGGVRGEDIIVYDVTGGRNIGQPIYMRFKGDADPGLREVSFLVGDSHGHGGRLSPTPDLTNPVRFSQAGIPAAFLPREVTGAQYMINMALLRPHAMAGLTLIGKNHFGSLYFPEDGGWSPRILHAHVLRTQAMGSYNSLVDDALRSRRVVYGRAQRRQRLPLAVVRGPVGGQPADVAGSRGARFRGARHSAQRTAGHRGAGQRRQLPARSRRSRQTALGDPLPSQPERRARQPRNA